MSIHYGISCDLCHRKDFPDRRYKCLICNDIDICSTCYDRNRNISIKKHTNHHPMQLIITSYDYERIYFGVKHTEHSPVSLTCSLCNRNGFSLNSLIKHLNKEHVTCEHSHLCPICFVRQNNLSKHLSQHIKINIDSKMKPILKNKENLTSNEYELKFNSPCLLNNFIYKHLCKNVNQQRSLFFQSLLIDLLN